MSEITSGSYPVIERAKLFIQWMNPFRITDNDNRASRRDLEFLPAVLEIQESPPSPSGRLLTWLIMIFCIIALIWAMIGEVDIVAVAQGKIIPSGHSKVIQPLEMSRVKAIYVSEGQSVKAGDVLVELDETMSTEDRDDALQQKQAMSDDIERLQALSGYIEQKRGKEYPVLSNPLQQSILRNQIADYEQQVSSLQNTFKQKQYEYRVIDATMEKLHLTLPIVEKRMQAQKNLYDQQLASEQQYLENEQRYIENRQELKAETSRLAETAAEIDKIKAQIEQYKHEFRHKTLQELVDKQVKFRSIEQQVIKTGERSKLQALKSPIDGVVQQLAVHTIGGVVSPAEKLMVIVPKHDSLEVEAYLQNKDIGFVADDQDAEIKVEAFPFTKYGVIEGKVLSVSNDAIQDKDKGLIFAMQSSLSRSTIKVNGKDVNLSPGMAVSVEVKTGMRHIIDYLVRPVEIMKYDAIKER